MKPSLSMVPSIYSLIWEAELVTPPSRISVPPRQANPHFDATIKQHSQYWFSDGGDMQRTEDFITDVVLPNEISEQFLVDTGSINNLQFYLSAFRRRNAYAYRFDLQQYPRMYILVRWLSEELAQLPLG